MNDWFKIIVCVLEHILRKERPLFDKPSEISIYVSDGIRRTVIIWSKQNGASFKL